MNILTELNASYIEKIKTEIDNIEALNNLQPNEDINKHISDQRITNFSEMMISLINNLSEFSNIVFN